MKSSKKEIVLFYKRKNPTATIKNIAHATGVSIPYVWKVVNESGKTKVGSTPKERALRLVSKSDGSTADYYELPKGAKELQDLISHKNMNAQIGEIFRACYRYGQVAHSKMLRDAKKIKYYAEAEIKRLERETDGNA